MNVTLSSSECAVAQMLASMRTLVSRAAGITNMKQGKQSQHKTEVEGMAAELAFAKHFNICPDMVIKPVAGGSDGILRGKTIDVKVTSCLNGRLLAHPNKKKAPSDIFALLIGEMPDYRIAGYAHAADLIHPDNLTDLGHGPVYAMYQVQLKQFKMNITTEELNTLNACQSDQDWRKACDAIKAVRNQEYPPDWWKRVKQTGLMDRIMQRWEGSSELEVIYPEQSPEDYEPSPYDGTYSEE